jgi:endonuclease/exonuclease/phosphatase family metal-dependent hydrolase
VTWHNFELIGTGREFVMGTTHLEAFNGLTRRRSAQLLRAYVTARVSQLGEDTPLFLTGDFNAVASSPEIRSLFGHHRPGVPLFDAWQEAGPQDADAGATFRGLGRWRGLKQAVLGPRRIDYVFYRPRLEIERVERIDFDRLVSSEPARPSDHFPVVAEFRL